jgi:hypothetical protein
VDPSTAHAIDILMRKADISAALISNTSAKNAADFSVKIDPNTKFQTITGFGAGLP